MATSSDDTLIGRRPDFARAAALGTSSGPLADAKQTFARNLRIVEALRDEAIALGRWRREDPLDGIEVKLRLAQALAALRDV